MEQRFRRVIIDRLQVMGASLVEVPGAWGNTLRFSLPGQPRQWTLTPQVTMHGCRPDFVLQSNDINIPAIAIFTDGHRFHAVPTNNRLADDAVSCAVTLKRTQLTKSTSGHIAKELLRSVGTQSQIHCGRKKRQMPSSCSDRTPWSQMQVEWG